jgi:hypothetical protein
MDKLKNTFNMAKNITTSVIKCTQGEINDVLWEVYMNLKLGENVREHTVLTSVAVQTFPTMSLFAS